ncbi:MAG: SLC13/DASS family transporter [Gammaproteobacteria bacterium]|nr:SLC13/DASS family transporter [Gammaproteobacteria bacterium]
MSPEQPADSTAGRERPPRARGGNGLALVAGPLLASVAYLLTGGAEAALEPPGRATAAVAVWMAAWWLTEAVPLAATAMLPLCLFPLLGVATAEQAAAPYANSLVFLFLGGFLIGLGMQRWGLHRRMALLVLRAAGSDTRRLVGAFMLVSALLSMWISNTATAIMLLPIATSLLASIDASAASDRRADVSADGAIGSALLLGIAYSSSIGGAATLIGTPPNLVLAAFLRERYDIDLGMLDWLAVGLPFALLMLPCAWLYLTRVACRDMPRSLPGSRALFVEQLHALGPWSRGERTAALVFASAVLAWMSRPFLVQLTGLHGLTDAVIAMSAGLALFAIPVDYPSRIYAMDWATARRLPWDILLLFGGGLTLADAIARHGVDAWLASAVIGLAGMPMVIVVLGVAALVVFLTEVTSNTAVAATLLPVIAATAVALQVDPSPLLVATALAASCAFMLPVATPPNAIVFSAGHVTIAQMARAGIVLNLVSILTITALMGLGLGSGLLSRP